MSEQSINEKITVIANENVAKANTKTRVAEVLADINETKANKDEVAQDVQDINMTIQGLAFNHNQDIQYIETHKLDKPTTYGDTTNYPYLVAVNGNGDPTRIDASSVGKNIYNSDGTFNARRVILGNDFGITWLQTKMGIGVFAYDEALQIDGNAIMNRLKLNVTSSNIPQALRTDGLYVYFQNNSGQEKRLLYRDYVDYLNLWQSFNNSQKQFIRNAMKLSTETYSVGAPRIDVLLLPFIDNTKNFIQYTTLVGLNLFVDNVTPNALIYVMRMKDANGVQLPSPEYYDVDNFTVLQNFPNNLNFGINWNNKPEGYYQVFVTHNGLTNPSSPELIVKAGLTYSQFTGIANWHKDSGGDSAVADTSISSGSQPTVYYTADLISTAEVNAGFMVSFSLNNQLSNYGANFVGFWRCGLIGNGDGVFYGPYYYDGGGNAQLPNVGLSVRNDTYHIAYYNGVVYVIAESNGKTYQQFNSTFNLYPKRFVFQLGGGGQGSISMQVLGKILLS